MTVNFLWFAERVGVVRRVPGTPVREWRTMMLTEGSHGLVRLGTDVRAGDEIYEIPLLGRVRRGQSRVVAHVDWNGRSPEKLGIITWVGAVPSRPRKEASVDFDIEVEALRLLDWLATRTGGGYQPVDEFLENRSLSGENGRMLRDYMLGRDWVRDSSDLSGFSLMLSASGMTHLREVRARRANPAERTRSLRRQMLCWLYEQDQEDPPNDWSGFLADERFTMLGEDFSVREVEAAAGYLEGRQLIISVKIEEAPPGVLYPRLTADGHDCVTDYEGNVSDYINRHQTPGTTNIHVSGVQGNTVIGDKNIVQNVSGLDADKLLKFAKFVQQVAPTLGLPKGQQETLEADAGELVEAAEAPNPERGRLRRLGDAVVAGLAAAAPSVVTSTAVTMGEEALKAITQ